jgi:hypothetical protein
VVSVKAYLSTVTIDGEFLTLTRSTFSISARDSRGADKVEVRARRPSKHAHNTKKLIS